MSNAIDPNFLRRVQYTPMRDWARLRWTGRLNWWRRIAESDLPIEIKKLVRGVVGKARLWKLEKMEVAEELLAHFADGLDQAEEVQTLVEKFGDARLAALLIGQAKRRQRSVWLQAVNVAMWAGISLGVAYLVMAVLFFSGRPSVMVDYAAVLNRHAEQTPIDQRAWPIYQNVFLSLKDMDRVGFGPEVVAEDWADARPGGLYWKNLVDWLNNKKPAIAQARVAASRHTLGWLAGPAGPENDPLIWQMRNNPGISPKDLGTLAEIVETDARVGRFYSNESRFVNDIRALLNMSVQIEQEGNIQTSLTAMTIYQGALELIERTLTDSPAIFSDADLRELSQVLSKPVTAADFLRIENEPIFMLDMMQRIYTDNGHGNGRLTHKAFELYRRDKRPQPEPIVSWLEPMYLLVSVSRKQLLAEYGEIIQLERDNFALPMRAASWYRCNQLIADYEEADQRDFGRQLCAESIFNCPEDFQARAEALLGHRDGILLAIALEQYHRERGHYPDQLIELTPRFISTIPADRITGDPVKYTLTQQGPVIYSVGEDRHDDGGVPGTMDGLPMAHATIAYLSKPGETFPGNFIRADDTAKWDLDSDNIKPGDWILYPQWKFEDPPQ